MRARGGCRPASALVAASLLAGWAAVACAGPPPSAAPSSRAPESSPSPVVEPADDLPPVAALIVDGRAVPGRLGGYTWRGLSDSVPWWPASALEPVEVDAGRELAVDVGAPPAGRWIARVALARDTGGEPRHALADGTGFPRFRAPPPGAWVIAVELRYGQQGDATWYWQVVVR